MRCGLSLEDCGPLLSRGWLARRSPETQAELLKIGRLRKFKPGGYVYRAGAPGTAIFGLIDGELDLILPAEGRPDNVVHRAEPGFWIGDLAVFSGRPRLVSVRAHKSTTMIALPARPTLELVRRFPELSRDFYALSDENMALALRFLSEALAFTGVERVARRLCSLMAGRPETAAAGGDWLEISQTSLAGMVGVSMPTVQRALRRLHEEGLIETGYGKLKVLDCVRLAQFVEFPQEDNCT
jgi:CRP-like cAMP-binding protein